MSKRQRVYIVLISGKAYAGKTTLAQSLERRIKSTQAAACELTPFAYQLKLEYSMHTDTPMQDMCTPGIKEKHRPALVTRAAEMLEQDPEYYARLLYDLQLYPTIQEGMKEGGHTPLIFLIDDHRYEAERRFLEACEVPGVTIVVRTVRVNASAAVRRARSGRQEDSEEGPSETSLDDMPADYWSLGVIQNDSTQPMDLVERSRHVFASLCKSLLVTDQQRDAYQEAELNHAETEHRVVMQLASCMSIDGGSSFISWQNTLEREARAGCVQHTTDLMGSPLK